MRKTTLTVLIVPLIAGLTVQSAGASERRHARRSASVPASEQYRNANAYAGYFAERSYLPNLTEGAMTSGIAGH
jgi:hypothetical protein